MFLANIAVGDDDIWQLFYSERRYNYIAQRCIYLFSSVSDNLVFLFEGQIQEAQRIFDLVLDAAIVYSALRGGLLPPQVHLILPEPIQVYFHFDSISLLSEDPECRKRALTRWDIKWSFTLVYFWVCLSKICWFIPNYLKISLHILLPKCSQFCITFPVKMQILVVCWVTDTVEFWFLELFSIFEMHKEFQFSFKHWRLSHLHDNLDMVHWKNLNHLFVPPVHIHVQGQSGCKRYKLVIGSETYVKINLFTCLWRLPSLIEIDVVCLNISS